MVMYEEPGFKWEQNTPEEMEAMPENERHWMKLTLGNGGPIIVKNPPKDWGKGPRLVDQIKPVYPIDNPELVRLYIKPVYMKGDKDGECNARQ